MALSALSRIPGRFSQFRFTAEEDMSVDMRERNAEASLRCPTRVRVREIQEASAHLCGRSSSTA